MKDDQVNELPFPFDGADIEVEAPLLEPSNAWSAQHALLREEDCLLFGIDSGFAPSDQELSDPGNVASALKTAWSPNIYLTREV